MHTPMKSKDTVNKGMRGLSKVMMPQQLDDVLKEIDKMMAQTNKTIDSSLKQSAQLVEQAQKQLMTHHQHLQEGAPSNMQQGNSNQNEKTDSGEAPGTHQISRNHSVNTNDHQTSHLAGAMNAEQNTAKMEASELTHEQQQLLASQKQVQQSTEAAQNHMAKAIEQLNQNYLQQQQAYEHAVLAKNKEIAAKSDTFTQAISQNLTPAKPNLPSD